MSSIYDLYRRRGGGDPDPLGENIPSQNRSGFGQGQGYGYQGTYNNNPNPSVTGGGSATQRAGYNQQSMYNSQAGAPQTPVLNNGVEVPSMYDLYNQRTQQSENIFNAQQQRIAAEKQSSQQRLRQQLAQQRQSYLQGLGNISEEGFMRGRNNLQQLSGRGLATSGLLQLGDVQGRMAQGSVLNQLAQGNTQAQQGLANAANDQSQSLNDALTQAELQRQSSDIGAGGDLYSMYQAEQQRAQAQGDAEKQRALEANMGILELILGGADQETITAAIQTYENAGIPITIPTDERGNPISGQQLSDFTGNMQKDQWDWGSVLASGGAGAAAGGALGAGFFGIGAIPGALLGGAVGLAGGALGEGAQDLQENYTYNIPGIGKQSYKSKDEALSVWKNVFKDQPGSDEITIDIKGNGTLEFKVGGKSYKTYESAYNALQLTK